MLGLCHIGIFNGLCASLSRLAYSHAHVRVRLHTFVIYARPRRIVATRPMRQCAVAAPARCDGLGLAGVLTSPLARRREASRPDDGTYLCYGVKVAEPSALPALGRISAAGRRAAAVAVQMRFDARKEASKAVAREAISSRRASMAAVALGRKAASLTSDLILSVASQCTTPTCTARGRRGDAGDRSDGRVPPGGARRGRGKTGGRGDEPSWRA